MNTPFNFYTRFNLVKLLGIKAKDPTELLEGLKVVSTSSIYYHTHRFLQQHHYLTPEPPNDFAYWVTNILNLKELGEAFASVDTVRFKDLEEMRNKFIRIVAEYLTKRKPIVRCQEGEEFHFMACTTVIIATPYVAHDLAEFIEVLQKISIDSLYFHVFESRLRLRRDENDFAAWCKNIGQIELAKELLRLDPYTFTLEGLRRQIVNLVKKYAKPK